MINRVVLVGRLTKDPVLKKTPSGASVVTFTVAVNRRVKSQDQETDFINCVAWNKVAELMEQYLHKGSLVGVDGRIQTRSYDDQTGRRVYVTEVIAESVQFLDGKNTSNQVPSASTDYNSYQTQPTCTSAYSTESTLDIDSDDLPF